MKSCTKCDFVNYVNMKGNRYEKEVIKYIFSYDNGIVSYGMWKDYNSD